ncbi:NACHT C-terminal alpha/beta 1 domain-containing protein [Planktothrix mougeotii]|uniref:NACHT domain-containing protein n=1 Tax=Planktothrix mougeotii LEGE 06226 TaxID=1828728 RepID=A0ABR9UIA8_9CYAN|nr:NACHT domain-containing protein [Planktothrix mougeotii]MBE9145901.1 NACHT domain-containing protein [Planktothrix mougeotii LEGE 06226]
MSDFRQHLEELKANDPEFAENFDFGYALFKKAWSTVTDYEQYSRMTSNIVTGGDGLEFEREDIYVPLGLIERQQRPKRDKNQGSPEQGSEIYQEKITPISSDTFFEEILGQGKSKSKGKRIAIIGEPGAGKTILLQKIAEWILVETDEIPVWVSLADLGKRSLREYILEDWLRDATQDLENPPQKIKDAFNKSLKDGKIWLLLDGVDEMGVDYPLQTLATQLKEGWIKNARIVLTCRLNLWEANRNELYNFQFDIYRNLNFNREQIHNFIENFFQGINPKRGEKLDTALNQAGKERICDLVKNPLRLVLLCWTWQKEEGNLPETKAELYRQFVEVHYEWNKTRTTYQQRQKLNSALGKLALTAIDQFQSRFRLRESFVRQIFNQIDPELFDLALTLGWLNRVGVASENPGEKVYAFYHPTFEEYFAALAIEDWDYFLPREHNNQNPQPISGKNYRIFEKQWKEVFLLWLGREDIATPQKEEFLQKLIVFQDNCDNYYRFQAHFIAALGVAEFKNFSQAENLFDQLVNYGFCSWDSNNNKWQSYPYWLEKSARSLLQETDYIYTVHALLEKGLENLQVQKNNPKKAEQLSSILADITYSLGKVDPEHDVFIRWLKRDLENNKNNRDFFKYTLLPYLKTLRKLAPSSIKDLLNFMEKIYIELYEQTTKQLETEVKQIEDNLSTDLHESFSRLPAYNDELERFREGIKNSQRGRKQEIFDGLLSVLEQFGYRNSIMIDFIQNLLTLENITESGRFRLIKLLEKIDPDYAARSSDEQNDDPISDEDLINFINSNPSESKQFQVALKRLEFNSDDSVAIEILTNLMENSQNEELRYDVAEKLIEFDIKRAEAIATLTELMNQSQDSWIQEETAKLSIKINHQTFRAVKILVDKYCPKEAPKETDDFWTLDTEERDFSNYEILKDYLIQYPQVIEPLSQILRNSQDDKKKEFVINLLGEVGKNSSNPIAVEVLTEEIINTNDSKTCFNTAIQLGKIDPGNLKAVEILMAVSQDQNEDELNRIDAVNNLTQMGCINLEIINTLLSMIRLDQEIDYFLKEALIKICSNQVYPEVISTSKYYLSSRKYHFFSLDDDLEIQEVLWNCAQNMSYAEFYQAWHRQPITTHPEMLEITGIKVNIEMQKLILQNLAQSLTNSIQTEPNLNASILPILIDSNTFIDPDNPSSKIYTEMVKGGCLTYAEGTPKTMIELQAYWDLLKSDRTVVLVFYDSQSLSENPQKFSEIFINQLKTFAGAIALITNQPIDQFQQFSPQDPQLIENLIKWMRSLVAEF